MKAKTLLCAAALALAASAGIAQDIDRSMLQHADMVVLPMSQQQATAPLAVISATCGRHSQPEAPFSEEELAWMVKFGSKSPENTARVCRTFHDRLST